MIGAAAASCGRTRRAVRWWSPVAMLERLLDRVPARDSLICWTAARESGQSLVVRLISPGHHPGRRGYGSGVAFITEKDMLHGSPLSGWTGRFFHSSNMTFARWTIDDGA